MQRLTCLLVAASLCLAACGGPTDEPAENRNAGKIILVTGATGTQGGAVARELLTRGYAVRGLTRSPGKPAAQALMALGAEMVQGDFNDPASLLAAMAGAHGVFAVTDFWEHGYELEVAHGEALIDAAEEAGIRHFVFSSVAGVDAGTSLAHFDSKGEIEQVLHYSDLDYSIVRPVSFMENWRFMRDDLLAGRYIDPRPPTDRHQWIAASDIGFFVGEAFDNPDDWIGRAEEIAGDELTLAELTALMSEVFGRPVEHVRPGWDDFEAAMGPELTEMTRWFHEDGYDVNIEALRADYPQLVTVRQYLEGFVNQSQAAAP